MSNQLLQTLKGFRDIFPKNKRKRDYILKKIVETYQLFGFEPLETPTLEYASLLLGKYGEEADKSVYTFEDQGGRRVGLRFDQTVPTARILAQYRYNLPKFFRRYQIQNVFRAEKPQKGRYREFTQCDIDIFGTTATLADAEVLACVYATFKNIGFKQVEVKVNDRQTLVASLQPFATEKVNVSSLIQSLDKLEKIKTDGVTAELVKKGLGADQAQQALAAVKNLQPSKSLTSILDQAIALGIKKSDLVFSPTLARGLDYYTGMIFEIVLPGYTVGSCGGGGRYDNLIEQLGGVEMPAVGFGLGFDRTVEAADQLGLIPELNSSSQVLITLLDENTKLAALRAATQLRVNQISVEIYPTVEKLGKQLKTANQKQIPWVIIIGEEEMAQNAICLKNMSTGEQETLDLKAAAIKIKQT